MSIWAKIAKYGGSALKGAGSVAKQGLKSASNTAVHPTQALRGAGSAMKTAAVGSAAGYVVWQNASLKMAQADVAQTDILLQQTIAKIASTTDRYERNLLGVKRDSLQARYDAMCGVVKMIRMRQKQEQKQ